jgi:hypothetical protein
MGFPHEDNNQEIENLKSENKLLKARLQNTEKAIFALATALVDIQPPYVQDGMNTILADYFEANSAMGFDSSNAEFITIDK